MKTLLRSCIISGPKDSKELSLRNFQLLNESGLDFDLEEDQLIWREVREFVQHHNHAPDIISLRTVFIHKKETSARDRLDELDKFEPKYGGDFHVILEARASDRRTRTTMEILAKAKEIATTGIEVQTGREKKKVQGAVEAIKYVLDASHDIMAPTLGTRLSGEVTHDGEDFMNRYLRLEADPLAGIGQHTGITQMDDAINGAKRYELWIHAAFTGGMKSTFVLNWLYNQAVFYQRSGLLFSLEMPYEQCRNLIYALHSCHPRFRLIRYWLGFQKNITADVGLDYKDIRDGTLSKEGRKFLVDYVVPDFNGKVVDVNHNPKTGAEYRNEKGETVAADLWFRREPDGKNVKCSMVSPENYGRIHIEVADPDKSDFTMADLKHRAEVIYGKDPYQMIIIDHTGLMSPRKWVSNTTDRLNEIIRDQKRLAMNFNRGQGMAVVALFQLSREGYKSAIKRKEKTGVASYDLTHLSYANEAERSADVVTASWMDDDLANANRVQFQCLKSRDQKPFEMLLARVEWPCRRILTCWEVPMSQKQRETVAEDIDVSTI